MDHVHKLKAALHAPEAQAQRRARRATRLDAVYAQIKEALGDVDGHISRQAADLWSLNSEEKSTRKIQGHAGASAAAYVGETMGNFEIRGTLRTRFAGMDREAGYGGHGITDGVITIDVEVTPIKGMLQVFEVPVQVKQGRMLQPGLFYHQGVPYVIAQSSIDEVMQSSDYGGEIKTDRKHLFSPMKQGPGRRSIDASDKSYVVARADDGSVMTRGQRPPTQAELAEFDDAVDAKLRQAKSLMQKQMVPKKEDVDAMKGQRARSKSDEAKAKQRRLMRNKEDKGPQNEGEFIHGGDQFPGQKAAAYDADGKWIKPWELGKSKDESRGDDEEPGEEQEPLENGDKNEPGMKGAALKQGQLLRLACEIAVPLNDEYFIRLPEASRVFVMHAHLDGVHIKHESGVEAFINPKHLVA